MSKEKLQEEKVHTHELITSEEPIDYPSVDITSSNGCKTRFTQLTNSLKKDFKKYEQTTLSIAFKLHEIFVNKLYKYGEYKNIYDFAQMNFNLSRGACHQAIKICKKFGKIEEDGTCHSILPEYQKYTCSQLAIMIRMDSELLEQITPDMSTRQMIALKKSREEIIDGECKEIPTENGTDTNTLTVTIEDADKPENQTKYFSQDSEQIEIAILQNPESVTEETLTNIRDEIKLLKRKYPTATPKLYLVW